MPTGANKVPGRRSALVENSATEALEEELFPRGEHFSHRHTATTGLVMRSYQIQADDASLVHM